MTATLAHANCVLYEAFLNKPSFAVFARETDYAAHSGGDWRNPGFTRDGSHHVVCVSWDDANAYVNWLAKKTGKPYRLQSEAEFEYAARAGTTTPFGWGSSITPAQATYDGNYLYGGGGSKGVYRKGTVPDGSFDANPWGLHNVHGNVWRSISLSRPCQSAAANRNWLILLSRAFGRPQSNSSCSIQSGCGHFRVFAD
jgi:hypothetical protein